jgi:Flp pilus assembly protein TadB
MSATNQEYQQQLAGAVQAMTRHLRSGNSVLRTFRSVAQETRYPIAGYFQSVVDDVAAGSTLDDALRRLVQRAPESNFALVIDTVQKHRQETSELATRLDSIIEKLNSAPAKPN